MLIIKAKNIIPKEKMKNIYEIFFKQMQDGLVLVDDRYEISIVEPSMEWIPVSERLPEECKNVIVTDIETSDTYQSQYMGNGYWDCDNGYFRNRIVAWMPLPEPYNEKEE